MKPFRQGISKTPPPLEKSLNASRTTLSAPTVQKIKKSRSGKREKPRKGWQTFTPSLQSTAITPHYLLILQLKFFTYRLLWFGTTSACMWATLIWSTQHDQSKWEMAVAPSDSDQVFGDWCWLSITLGNVWYTVLWSGHVTQAHVSLHTLWVTVEVNLGYLVCQGLWFLSRDV